MHPEFMRYNRAITTETHRLFDVAAEESPTTLKNHIAKLINDKRYAPEDIAMTLAKVIHVLHARSVFFELTMVEAVGNHVDYLLTAGLDKVSSEHIDGAMGVLKLIEEMRKKEG